MALLELLHQAERHGRAAADHEADARQVRRVLVRVTQQVHPDRRHRGRDRHALGGDQLGQRRCAQVVARHDEAGAGEDRAVRDAPGVRVEHRHHRHHAVVRAHADRVGHALPHRVQHVGAVRVEHALGIAGGPARVAEAGGLAVVQGRVVVPGVLRGQQRLVAERVRKRAGVAVADHHVVAHRVEPWRQLLQHRHERVLHEDHPILGVPDHVFELVREQPDVQGVEHGAHGRHGEVGLEVLPGVPGERGHPIARSHAERLERGAEPVRPIGDFGVCRARPVTAAHAHHLGPGVEAPHALQDQLERQRMVVLHQPLEHGELIPEDPPTPYRSAGAMVRRLLSVLLPAVALCTAAGPARADQPVSSHAMVHTCCTPAAMKERIFAEAGASGAEFVRVDVELGGIFDGAGSREHPDWRALDEVIALAERHDIRVLGLILGIPTWLSSCPERGAEAALCPARDTAEFGRLAARGGRTRARLDPALGDPQRARRGLGLQGHGRGLRAHAERGLRRDPRARARGAGGAGRRGAPARARMDRAHARDAGRRGGAQVRHRGPAPAPAAAERAGRPAGLPALVPPPTGRARLPRPGLGDRARLPGRPRRSSGIPPTGAATPHRRLFCATRSRRSRPRAPIRSS